MPRHDTIYALSSGGGRSGVAVFRITGPQSHQIAVGLGCGSLIPRTAHLRTLRNPRTGSVLDQALVLAFEAPRSFTGEDSLELHVHGGVAVIRAMNDALSASGARPAEAGEFTRRAFENGKIDLTEVEGLSDLLAADTEAQRAQAVALARGGLSRQVQEWRTRLIQLMSMVEADVDFTDEEDAPTLDPNSLCKTTFELAGEIGTALAAAQRGRKTREGYLVVLAGAPNAGKSTLLNALAGRDVAIVSAIPGTTRDALELPLEIEGQSVILVDTAGLRDTSDAIETMGLQRTRERLRQADLVLWLQSADAHLETEPGMSDIPLVRVWTKSDLYSAPAGQLAISARTGAGLSELLQVIGARLELSMACLEVPLVTHARQLNLLEQVCAELNALHVSDPIEIVAERLRLAARALGRLSGAVDVEDVLGEIFARFCIGK